MLIPLFIAAPAFAGTQGSGRSDTAEQAAKLNEAFSVLHAVGQYSTNLSEMANTRAKSDLVKGYAREMASSNANLDTKLQAVAQKHGVDVGPLDPQTEEGQSLLDRINAETVLLGSIKGDAWDREYMTLVTNTQQSVIHLLDASKGAAKDQEVKQFFGDLTTTVQGRLKRAQDIMAKVYSDKV